MCLTDYDLMAATIFIISMAGFITTLTMMLINISIKMSREDNN